MRFLLLLLLLSTSVLATNTTDYFKSLEQIKKPPLNASPVLPCSEKETKQVLAWLKKDFGPDDVKVYKGDFSNDGQVEYAVVTTGGTMHVNTVSVYKQNGNNLIDMNLDQIITDNLIPGYDMSNFYYHVADPFAVILNGKTYLRFMNYPGGSRDYDKTKLMLCTYLWKANKITLTGPNWGFASKHSNISAAKNCIGA